MPKGDRLKLKADPEDGTTPIANLLLEAVAMAKISGLQKGAIIYLWRKTYGWVGDDGKRLKECTITLQEWCKALDRSKARTSEALSGLSNMNIIKRRQVDVWGSYIYGLNTNISQWNSDSINLSKLAETVSIHKFGTVAENVTVADSKNSCPKQNGTVALNRTEQLPKTATPSFIERNIKERLKKGSNTTDKNQTEYLSLTFEEYVEVLRNEYTDLDIDDELKKFRLWWGEGKKKLKRPKSAFRNWLIKAREIKGEKEGSGGTHRRRTQAPTKEQYLRSVGQ